MSERENKVIERGLRNRSRNFDDERLIVDELSFEGGSKSLENASHAAEI